MENNKQHVVNAVTGDAVARSKDIELTVNAGVKDLLLAMPQAFKDKMGGAVQTFGEVTAIALRERPAALFNQVMGLGISQPAMLQDIDSLISWLQQNANPIRTLTLAQGAQPAQLPQWLLERGLTLEPGGLARFWREPTPAVMPDSALTVRQVQPEEADAFAEVFCQSFGFSAEFGDWYRQLIGRKHWFCYLAYDGEKPVATGSFFVHDGLALLCCGATLEEYRGRGAQSLLLAHRIEQARKAQAHGLVIDTGYPNADEPFNGSYRNIIRAGFTLSYVLQRYMLA